MAKLDEKQERLWATFCHLGGLGAFIIPCIGNIIIPLIIWLIKKDESSLVDDQGKEAVNFQISMTIYGFIAAIIIFIGIGILLVLGVVIVDIVFMIIAAIKANNGEKYRYPLAIRFIK